jgi:hypothetical protein
MDLLPNSAAFGIEEEIDGDITVTTDIVDPWISGAA